MTIEDIEKEFEDIAKKSQHLFEEPVTVSSDPVPTMAHVEPMLGKEKLLPYLDTNLDFISKITRLLYIHDILKEDIYRYQKEVKRVYRSGIAISIVKELKDLEDIEQFRLFKDEIYALLKEVHDNSKEYKTTEIYVSPSEIEKFNAKHEITDTFLIRLNNILQRIHSMCLDIISEYNMLAKTYIDEKGLESTRILFFQIGSIRVINIEPYNLPNDIIYFINAFNEEIKKSKYASYANILFIKSDNKYRIDLTLGAAYSHRAVVIYDTNPEEKYFEHIYVDGNYSRTLAWKIYMSDYLNEEINKVDINILDTDRPQFEDIEEGEEKPKPLASLAWRDSFLKVRIEKEYLLDLAIIIYLINWDGLINHSSRYDIMSVADEAEIIYQFAVHPKPIEFEEYIPGKTRFTVEYDSNTQRAIRDAIKKTASGVENFLLPE